ncbi:methyltransferase domain-containing protein, partial [Candidatus Woesearchaeota archaeon]|nr:methyltransferase domain-containing protein [Candidatus Woesearchaeota archaeon]
MVNFTPYEVNLCLYDQERTRRFKRAIHKVVKPGDVVVDAGSGTGILAMFAAQSGAKKVYALELNKRFIKIIKENAKRNDFDKIIQVVHCDATKYKLPEKVDVIICELLSTGLFFEPEIQIINHLKRFLKKGGRTVPKE